MSAVFDCQVYHKTLKGGDTFDLKDTDKPVHAHAPNGIRTLVKTSHTTVWVQNKELTSKNSKIYAKQVDDWNGKIPQN